MDEDELTHCTCGPEAQIAPHTCPYQYDVHNDDKFMCTCCDKCETECADDI